MMASNTGNLIRAFRANLMAAMPITLAGQMSKLAEEVAEATEAAEQEPREDFHRELADVVIVCMMAAECSDLRVETLMRYVDEKMVINLSRSWKPSESGTAHHV